MTLKHPVEALANSFIHATRRVVSQLHHGAASEWRFRSLLRFEEAISSIGLRAVTIRLSSCNTLRTVVSAVRIVAFDP